MEQEIDSILFIVPFLCIFMYSFSWVHVIHKKYKNIYIIFRSKKYQGHTSNITDYALLQSSDGLINLWKFLSFLLSHLNVSRTSYRASWEHLAEL